jgi:hypothetical protein
MNLVRELSVQCKYIRASSSGWRTKTRNYPRDVSDEEFFARPIITLMREQVPQRQPALTGENVKMAWWIKVIREKNRWRMRPAPGWGWKW